MVGKLSLVFFLPEERVWSKRRGQIDDIIMGEMLKVVNKMKIGNGAGFS